MIGYAMTPTFASMPSSSSSSSSRGSYSTVSPWSSVDLDRLWSEQQALQQMSFQAYMSNTAYQRAVEDMKKAGLNPMLLYQGSTPVASTPSGAMATSSATYTAREMNRENNNYKLLNTTLNGLFGLLKSAVPTRSFSQSVSFRA